MKAGEFLDWLRLQGAELTAVGDRLKVSAPLNALTSEVKEGIARHKRELLDLLAADPAAAGRGEPPLLPIARSGKLPLSLFQQRLWIVSQLQADDEPSHNMVTLWEIKRRDPVLLRRAIDDLVRRHEILRSTIRSDGIAPFIHVLPPEAVSIAEHDIRNKSPDAQRLIAETDRREAVAYRFDLSCEPPLRWLIYILGDEWLALRVCAHHFAMDQWSFSLLRRELDASLSACAAGATLLPPTLQYVDFAAWERRCQGSQKIAAQLDWWERRLANLPAFCALPPDRRSAKPASAVHGFYWDKAFTTDLRSFAQAHRATLYMLLLAAFSAVLSAHTGLGDIAIGSPLGVRSRPELETMLGPFVSLVVLRLAVDDDPTFATLLDRARGAMLDAHDHGSVPFEMLVERLKPTRSFEHAPLCQVALVLHNAVDGEQTEIHGGGVDHHMTWLAREVDGALSMSLQYRADIYEPETMERVTAHLETLLRKAIRDPRRPVGAISLLDETERATVTQGFNSTDVAIDSTPLPIQFERQVALRPDAIAVRFEGLATPYVALNRRANQIARHLRNQGAGPGGFIGICLNRSVEMVACLLAVLKTGAAYVPLDPKFPAARIDGMIEDSGIGLLVTSGGAPAPEATRTRVVDLASDAGVIEGLDSSDLGIMPANSDPAYVIYTSGSTGRPNGVVVPHSALSNFLRAMLREPGLSADDVLAAVTTISFDIAGLELYLPLIVGASILLVPQEVAADGTALVALLGQERVTIMQATPATWRLLIEAGWMGGDDFTALCGGEALTADLADLLISRAGSVWNLYGPTETTIWSTAEKMRPGFRQVAVGRPIANTQVFIVDRGGEPVPVGIPGEIWIGGSGVALGYHRNTALTSAKFVNDPFRPNMGGRLYRTGDLGRWLPDGRIVHLGRMDQQLKLRGFRIEPGEIEASLTMHPSVRQAAVLLRGATPEAQRLVAYVVFQPGSELTSSEARAYLRGLLPEYMVPSVYVQLDDLPLTPNGKVDRNALPTPFRHATASSAAYLQPAPGAEQFLARIWADFLKVNRVGANDNFFDLGGHSLLALRVAAAVHEETGWRMPPRDLFVRTLSQIAASLQSYETGLRVQE